MMLSWAGREGLAEFESLCGSGGIRGVGKVAGLRMCRTYGALAWGFGTPQALGKYDDGGGISWSDCCGMTLA